MEINDSIRWKYILYNEIEGYVGWKKEKKLSNNENITFIKEKE